MTGYEPVDSDVQPEELNELCLVAKAEEVGQVPRVVLGRIDGRKLAATVDVAVDTAGNVRELGDAIRKW